MIDDLDIFRAAKVIVDHHGEHARSEALDRMEQFRADGNEQAIAVWFRIANAVEAIQMQEKPFSDKAH